MAKLVPEPNRINNNDAGWSVRTFLNGFLSILSNAINLLSDSKADNKALEEVRLIASNAQAGMTPMGSVNNEAELLAKPKRNNDAYFRLDTKDAQGNPYIWRYDAELGEWINTKQIVFTQANLSEGAVTNNQKVSVTADFYITIPEGMDIYDNKGTHIRLDQSHTFKGHAGSGRIQYDPTDQTFSSSHIAGLKRNAILVGSYSGQEVQLINSIGTITQLDADGVVKGVLYRAIYDKDLLQNASFSLTCRAGVSIVGQTIKLTTGDMYLQMGDGRSKTIKISEIFIYEFTFPSVLVVSSLDSKLYVRDNRANSTDKPRYTDIILINYDTSQGGIFDGILYNFYNNNFGAKLEFNKRNPQAVISNAPVFKVNLVSREITMASGSVDIYYGLSSFMRIAAADFHAQIAATGTSRLWFDAENKTFKSGGKVNDNYYLLGNVDTGRIFMNQGRWRVEYSDESVQNGSMTSSFVKEFAGDVLPAFVREEAMKTFNRLMAWAKEHKIILFAIITDIHSAGRYTYKHLGYLAEISKMFGFDFVLNNGDVGVGNANGTNTTATAQEFLSKFAIEHGKFDCPTLFGDGNHEQDLVDGLPLAKSLISNYLQKPSQRKFPQIKIEENKLYGYMDIAHKNTRVIFLDSNDAGNDDRTGYQYHKTQLAWLVDTLTDTPDDYMIIVASHRFPHTHGDWLSGGKPNPTPIHERVINIRSLDNILSAFVAKAEGMSHPDDNLNLSFDFKQKSGLLAGVVCGDSHFDVDVKVNGVNKICTQGYGGISVAEKPPHATVTSFDPNTQMLIDVVAIKPDTREMKYFRIGAGGESRDRDFTF